MTQTLEIYRSRTKELPSQADLLDACHAEYDRKHGKTNNLLYSEDGKICFFVKFGWCLDASEARNQMYFQEKTADSSAIRTPEIYWVFTELKFGFTYIVVE